MRWIDLLRRRLRALTRSSAVDADLRDEMQAHLDHLIQQHVDAGLSPSTARTAALREFGGVAAIVDDARQSRGTEWAHRTLREIRWAWRGVRARGWRAVFVLGIISIALAATATTFAVVDSLVFNQHPFLDPDRIMSLASHTDRSEPRDAVGNSALLARWREQNDVISAVGGYMYKSIFLMHDGTTDHVETADFTTDILGVLGVKPKWGRGFIDADTKFDGVFAALIREDLARQLFGSPREALGQRLEASGAPLIVVGVMPMQFAFPNADYQVWRAFDPNGPLTYMHGVSYIARLRDDIPVEAARTRLSKRAPEIGRLAGYSTYTAEAKPLFPPREGTSRDTLLLVLLGSAVCLLLAACASVTNMELAVGISRAQTRAVHLALGAPRTTLARVAALEGALLIGGALAAALGLCQLLIAAIGRLLPESLRSETQNPSSMSVRVVAFTAVAAVLSWMIASLPAVFAAARSEISTLLKTDSRAAASSRTTSTLRQWLTVVEVALAVALIVGGLLYAQSYQRLLAVEKGFDSHGLAEVSMSMPRSFFALPGARAQFNSRLMSTLRAIPGVIGVTNTMAPPSKAAVFAAASVFVDGERVPRDMSVAWKSIDVDYFKVVGLPLKSGRFLEPGDPETSVLVSESAARRLWPGIDPIGHSLKSGQFDERVVGVVGDFRTNPTRMPDITDAEVYLYTLAATPGTGSAAGVGAPAVDTGSSFAMATVTVRLSSLDRVADLTAAVRRFDSSLQSEVTLVDDTYAGRNVDTRLAGQVVGAFSIVALLIAITGIYGVMAFLVASRRREIGIRMALGADHRSITRMVLGSSTRLVLIGTVAGACIALLASRWVKSQLFGVSPTDPLLYLIVAAIVFFVAMVATWQPARRAVRVDPAIALRAE